MKTICTYLIVLLTFCSCGKAGRELSLEQKQKEQELHEALKSNELLEQEGLRFIVRTAINDPAIIDIDLKLYKGSGASKSTVSLPIGKDGNMNYYILSKQMEDNSEYTLTIEYKKVLQNAPYDLYTEGFTSMNGSKEFLVTGRSFNTADAGTSKDLILIKKGILKFTVYELQP